MSGKGRGSTSSKGEKLSSSQPKDANKNPNSHLDGFSTFFLHSDNNHHNFPHSATYSFPYTSQHHFPFPSTFHPSSHNIRSVPTIIRPPPNLSDTSHHVEGLPHNIPYGSTSTSSNQSNSSREKTFIQPTATGFIPDHVSIVRAITSIVHSKFDGPYPSWKEVPQDLKDLCFAEFQKTYCWDPEENGKVKDNFANHVRNGLKNTFSEARKHPNKRLSWISQENWDKLFQYWRSEEFKSKCAKNKENRASDTGVGSSLHTGGSIPIEEHARRMAKDSGGKVSWAEVYKHTHQRKKDKSWVDEKAGKNYEKFEKYKADHCSSQGSIGNSSTNVDAGDKVQQPAKSDFEIWKEAVGLTKRGQLHEFGPMGTAEIKGSSSGGSTSKKFLSWKEDPEFQEYLNSRLEEERSEKERHKRELDQYMKKTDKLGKIMKTLIKQFGGSVSEILSDNEE